MGLPCVKCAKRLILIKSSKNATKAEKLLADADGTVNGEALKCRWSAIKCSMCKSGRKNCVEVSRQRLAGAR